MVGRDAGAPRLGVLAQFRLGGARRFLVHSAAAPRYMTLTLPALNFSNRPP
jgi:hypothetical protein